MQPPPDTLERWAWDYIHGTSLSEKLAPPPLPVVWEEVAIARRVEGPGRPAELRTVGKAKRRGGVSLPSGRARILHTFLHHELQAAELMAWALLAFPETPREFRAGLLRIALDEVRHMNLYAAEIERLGAAVGDFEVRDWFWERIPSCPSPASFVATMGLGLESANLEHAASFAVQFREAGDEQGARTQELVGREEIAHVRFGAHWFQRFSGELSFERWRRELAPPLTPLLMRGRPFQRETRLAAGFPSAFLDEFDAWQPE